MESSIASAFKGGDLISLALVAVVAGGTSLAVFLACYYWFRYEQRRIRKKILQAIVQAGSDPEELLLVGPDMEAHGEIVAQFKLNHGKQVVSVLESSGVRFIHIDGDLAPHERAKMMRYLKSEGFVS